MLRPQPFLSHGLSHTTETLVLTSARGVLGYRVASQHDLRTCLAITGPLLHWLTDFLAWPQPYPIITHFPVAMESRLNLVPKRQVCPTCLPQALWDWGILWQPLAGNFQTLPILDRYMKEKETLQSGNKVLRPFSCPPGINFVCHIFPRFVYSNKPRLDGISGDCIAQLSPLN